MARAKVLVTCDLEATVAVTNLREFVCRCQRSLDQDTNPLPEFNRLLDIVAQEAFDAGRAYEKTQ